MAPLLLVEDDPSVRSTITTFLELEGYTVEAVSSTREAFARLSSRSYPIVISDIYIDDHTGIDILKAARAANEACYVILMSARGSMETVISSIASRFSTAGGCGGELPFGSRAPATGFTSNGNSARRMIQSTQATGSTPSNICLSLKRSGSSDL